MTDDKTIQAAEEAFPDRKLVSGGYYIKDTQLHFHNERLAFIKGVEWQASQQRGEQPSQPPSVSVEAIMTLFDEAVEASIEHGDEDDAQDWLDIKDVGVEFRSRLASLLNGQQKG